MKFAWELADTLGKIIKSGHEDTISHAVGVVLESIHERGSSMVILNRSPKSVSGFSSDGKLLWKVTV